MTFPPPFLLPASLLRPLPIRVKMVDVVSPSTMPSETEVHVARSFLTKILRSSMRYHPVSLCLAVFTGSFLVDLHGVRSLCFVFFCSSLMCMVLAVQVSLVYLHICVCHQFCDVGITRFYTYSALTSLACMVFLWFDMLWKN